MCMEISGSPLFWNIMVESVLLSKPNALSSQVSVKSIVWWVSLAGASLLNLRKCLDFVHREDCRQASSASTLTTAALEESSILWSPGQCSAVVLWACPGRGRREQPESKWSARKAWGYFPSRPEKKMIRKVTGSHLSREKIHMMLPCSGSIWEHQKLSRWWGNDQCWPPPETPESRWLERFDTRPRLSSHMLGLLWGFLQGLPGHISLSSLRQPLGTSESLRCHNFLLAPVAWVFYHWRHSFRLSHRGEDVVCESHSLLRLLGGQGSGKLYLWSSLAHNQL